METSEQVNELAGALAKAQAEIKGAAKDRTNPHFGSKYSTLDSLWEAIRGPLSTYGLSLVQGASSEPDGEGVKVIITTLLLHASGQWIKDTLAMYPKDASPQAMGSVITYGRRYGAGAMTGVTSDEDDDGNGGQGDKEKKKDVPGYYRAKPPASTEQVKYDNPEVLKTVSEELLPNTDNRDFLEQGITRKCKAHQLAQTEMMALGLHFLGKGTTLKRATPEALDKFYQFLMDPQAVADWRVEFKRKMEQAEIRQ